jgi:NADPH:quinone reductase-like Zn-dependent oxidoreductase
MILATASSNERLERLKPLGMDAGINYREHEVPREVRRLTDNHGADVVVDSVGGSTLQGSINSLAYRGRVSMVGAAGREPVGAALCWMQDAVDAELRADMVAALLALRARVAATVGE